MTSRYTSNPHLLTIEKNNHLELQVVQLSSRSPHFLDIVYKTEGMKTVVLFKQWQTSKCQLGKKLLFSTDFQPLMDVRSETFLKCQPHQRFSKIIKSQASILAKKQAQNEESQQTHTFKCPVFNDNSFSIMFFTQVRIEHHSLEEETLETQTENSSKLKAKSPKLLVSNSLMVNGSMDDLISGQDLGASLVEVQESPLAKSTCRSELRTGVTHLRMDSQSESNYFASNAFLQMANKMKYLNAQKEKIEIHRMGGDLNQKTQDFHINNPYCKVLVKPDKDIICSKKSKDLEIEVTFFVKGSFKVFIDIFSFPVGSVISGQLYPKFADRFFSDKNIHRFVSEFRKRADPGLFDIWLESKTHLETDLGSFGTSKHLSKRYSHFLTRKTYYRRDSTHPTDPLSSGLKNLASINVSKNAKKKEFIEIVNAKFEKADVLHFLKKNVSKRQICKFLARFIWHVNPQTVARNVITARAQKVCQASLEVREVKAVIDYSLIFQKPETQKSTSSTIKNLVTEARLPESMRTDNHASDKSLAIQRNISEEELERVCPLARGLTFVVERMSFEKKTVLLVNNGESTVQFQLSFAHSVFQESNLRDETQIDQFETEVNNTLKTQGMSWEMRRLVLEFVYNQC